MPRGRFLGFVLLLPSLVLAADWPQFLGPQRDGSTPVKISPWKGDLKATWRLKVSEGHSSPIVVGERVYLHTRVPGKDEEQLTAYALADGKVVWNQSYARGEFKSPFGQGPRATPTFDDGHLYTLGGTGLLTCWKAEKGEKVWQVDVLKTFKGKNLYFGVSGSPLIAGDNLYLNVGAPGASLVAFNKKTGEVVWKEGDATASYASPIQYGKGAERQILFFTQQGLQAVDPATGQTQWKFGLVDALNESSTTPVPVGDVLLASSITYGMVGIKVTKEEGKATAKQVWKDPGLPCYFSTPVAVGDHVYAVTGRIFPPVQSSLHCLDPKTGKVLWTKQNVGKYHAALVRTGNNKLLMLDDYGNLSLLDPSPEGFKELAKSKVGIQTWVTPAVVPGKVVLRDERELMCFPVEE